MNRKLILTSAVIGILTIGATTYGGVRNLTVGGNTLQIEHQASDLYPLRKICDQLSVKISSVTSEHIVLQKDGNIVTLNRQNQYLKNAKGYFMAGTAPIQKDGQTYVDLNVLEKMFGFTRVQTDIGTVINEVATFQLPVPTEKSQKLNNDVNYIAKLEDEIDINYYRASIETGIREYNITTIQAARDKIAGEVNIINEITTYIQTSEGKAVVESYRNLLNAYNQILKNAFNLNVREMTNYFIRVMEAEDDLSQIQVRFTNALEKNATRLY
ncbi:stalk domain-containing protein [Cellulosilyticum ruminicola]|uniref:stalk domain-containing protein n=1 Tax=Cellulosilyticum ruminicola TaxID=425254 RepID=UPI0006D02484|nr:stalk domain-containing protein [Cellulosilyticum ruminicola]